MLLLDGQVHHDTHVIPMGNYVIGVGNYVIATIYVVRCTQIFFSGCCSRPATAYPNMIRSPSGGGVQFEHKDASGEANRE